jgi:hypothetical protein
VSGGIFLLRGGDELVPMTEAPYDTEDVLQELLAKFPDLLAGDQFAGADARRWILIERESAVPDAEEGMGRWSVDHVFLDQDGVPTLVEVKRSSDPPPARGRRTAHRLRGKRGRLLAGRKAARDLRGAA